MRSIIRNAFLAQAFLAATTLASNSATAETLKVPFTFTAAGKTCPAGVYSVQRDNIGNLVTLRSRETSQSFSWTVAPGNPSPTASGVILTFDQDGQAHTLRSVQVGSMVTSRLDNNKIKSGNHGMTPVQGQ